MLCKKCNKQIPRKVWVGEKQYKISKTRSYCLDCSPFGEKNTRVLVGPDKRKESDREVNEKGEPICKICKRRFNIKQNKGTSCWGCWAKNREKIRKDLIYSIVGYKCWRCGYNRTTRGLCFHHTNPSEKLFNISGREYTNLAWKNVFSEMKKCCLLCQNCHSEYHDGLISEEEMAQLYQNNWDKINEREGRSNSNSSRSP